MTKKSPTKTQKNPNSLANLKPPFDGTFAGPGRPRLPDSVKERRALLRKKLEEIAIDATELLHEVVNDDAADCRDRIRAAEISLSHSLPKQEEVTIDDERPLRDIPESQLEAKLAHIRSSRNGNHSGIGEAA